MDNFMKHLGLMGSVSNKPILGCLIAFQTFRVAKFEVVSSLKWSYEKVASFLNWALLEINLSQKWV